MRIQYRRTPTFLALLAATALAATGCGSSGGSGGTTPAPPPPSAAPRPPGQVDIVTGQNSCVALPKDPVVIDWKNFNGGLPNEVTWERHPSSWARHKVHFMADAEVLKIFPGFAAALPANQNSRKSGAQDKEPPWNRDSDGDGVLDSYDFSYVIKTNGEDCDPDICIRKNAGGCN